MRFLTQFKYVKKLFKTTGHIFKFRATKMNISTVAIVGSCLLFFFSFCGCVLPTSSADVGFLKAAGSHDKNKNFY
jgi:hypothetical protein